MIKDIKLWVEFEAKWLAENKPTFEENLKKFLHMLEIYKSVERHPKHDPLDGIEVKIRMAKILNSLKPESK